jgi:hypothetical protein
LEFRARDERRAKLARGRLIDQEHCDRIKPGMTQAEVEAVLGGPPGDFRTNFNGVYFGSNRPGWRDEHRVDRVEEWIGDQGRALAGFNHTGTVEGIISFDVLPLPSRSPGWFRYLWP